jgi:ubiquinone biosynthesis accessory factor UbiK
MAGPRLLDDIQAKLDQVLASGPAKDLERNAKTLVGNALSKMDVATRDELDAQSRLLDRALERIAKLEARVGELEQRLAAR